MNIETLAKQGRSKIHSNLAGIETAKLKQMRNQALRDCFSHINEMQYRMEFVATIHGKQFVNDAAANTVNATWYALESTQGNIIWITRGTTEKQNLKQLISSVQSKVQRIICIGDATQIREVLATYTKNVEEVSTMHEAVNSALYGSLEQATVLYSPACKIDNIEEEGDNFRYEVNEL